MRNRRAAPPSGSRPRAVIGSLVFTGDRANCHGSLACSHSRDIRRSGPKTVRRIDVTAHDFPNRFGIISALLAIAATLLSPAGVRAQDVAAFYRGKTISVTAGFAAGGGADAYARLIARHLGRHMPGNPNILVRNMQG